MSALTAKPNLLKQANLSYIRKIIKDKGTATRAEIVNETKISSTTVRSLLNEMMEHREIECIGHDESSGGRKAQRYRFKPDRYYCAAFCIADKKADALLINICGEIIETTSFDIKDGDFETPMISYLDLLITQKELKSIGIGVPGIVEKESYWKKNVSTDELVKIDIGDVIAQRYGVPVILENDLNATAIGFGRCFQKKYPKEQSEHVNMAFLHFEEGCISAGFISGGRIIRGHHNYAGELGLISLDNSMDNHSTLDECLARSMNDFEYISLVINIISCICGILNPWYIALGGPGLRSSCIGPISDELYSLLPTKMLPEILYAPDVLHDYHDGMAYLTAGKIFDEIQFIKE